MAIPISENKMFHPALRALQILFAIIVMGTVGYGTSTIYKIPYSLNISSNVIV
jgi:hypothetical protein